ncbi:RNA polymerase sigma factor [Mucisphaera calidilacus]|uniref:RNA polymerase sigma factor SigV n=1 Tax=Mucisphaera calidilacus TaxID=2527982 RepID=A0A518BWK0_9BACT|nr:sigma-70 family RNA polymerase sigma factor [Mucisphaera calidilacus]QDU71350.1 RNA polymerase sigma factor SigV [Mucisphaera calidilacus]
MDNAHGSHNEPMPAARDLVPALQDVWYRYALSVLRDEDQAMEAAQETALRVIKRLPHFDGRSTLRTWTLGITVNVCREIRRRRRWWPLASDERTTHDTDRLIQIEDRQQLHALIRQLPDRQREAVVLRFFEHLSTRETAEAMGCQPGTVKAAIHQAIGQMRTKWGDA